MSTTTTGKINDTKLLRLVDRGESQAKIAQVFGVSRQAVNKRLKELRGRTTKVVVAKKVEQIVDRKIDAIEQLEKINQSANEVLNLVMAWIRGEPEAIQVLEKSIRQIRVGTDKNGLPRFVEEFKFKDPHEIALKAMAEIRGQLSLQLDLFKTLYDLKAVEEFQQEVLATIGEASPEVRSAIIGNLNKRRALRAAVRFD